MKNGLQNFAFNKFNALYHYLENYAHSFNTGGQPGAARGAGSAVNRGLLTPPPSPSPSLRCSRSRLPLPRLFLRTLLLLRLRLLLSLLPHLLPLLLLLLTVGAYHLLTIVQHSSTFFASSQLL